MNFRVASGMITGGMDQGSALYDIVLLEENAGAVKVVLDKSFTARFVRERPRVTLETLSGFEVRSVVVPSGFGTRLKLVREMTPRDFLEISLKRQDYMTSSLANVIAVFKQANIDTYVIPAVKQLPTVPRERRFNRIDLGTSDKVCAAALGIYTQSTRSGAAVSDTEFILAELGSAFNAFVAVSSGEIVNGIGGTLSSMGMSSRGAFDGEIAALLGTVDKRRAYEGGVLYLFANGETVPEEFFLHAFNGNERARVLMEAYTSGILGDIGSMMASSGIKPKEVFISGRVSRVKQYVAYISEKIEHTFGLKVSFLETFGALSKEGAIGAALIANGIAGGRFSTIVDTLRLREATGSVFDDIYLDETTLRWIQETKV